MGPVLPGRADAEARTLLSGEPFGDVPVTGLLLAGKLSEPVLVAIGLPLGPTVMVTVMVIGLPPEDPVPDPLPGGVTVVVVGPLPSKPPWDGDEPLPLPMPEEPP